MRRNRKMRGRRLSWTLEWSFFGPPAMFDAWNWSPTSRHACVGTPCLVWIDGTEGFVSNYS
jgi:hypothetical protein